MYKSAVISECGLYRYELHRIWDQEKAPVMFVMLNPSTADADHDDPTIRRCIDFAKRWGYGGIMVGNLYAYRATNPKELINCVDPVGFSNSGHLMDMAIKCTAIVLAWGNSRILKKMPKSFPVRLLGWNLYYLKKSKDGTPVHPLYLPKVLTPKQYLYES